MLTTTILPLMTALTLAVGGHGLHYETVRVPPGDPCGAGPGKGTGNPCNGNRGNSGRNGNAGRMDTTIPSIPKPDDEDRGAYITQIGADHEGRIDQEDMRQFARVTQRGSANEARIEQRGAGAHFADLSQSGDRNAFDLRQEGPDDTVLYASQTGEANRASVAQAQSGAIYNAALVSQNGDRNTLLLAQDGSDNQAILTQTGSDNLMTATQLGDGNRLQWEQVGSNLSDLMIRQDGGAALQVTQTGPGR